MHFSIFLHKGAEIQYWWDLTTIWPVYTCLIVLLSLLLVFSSCSTVRRNVLHVLHVPWQEILGLLYRYISLIRAAGPQQEVFQEIRRHVHVPRQTWQVTWAWHLGVALPCTSHLHFTSKRLKSVTDFLIVTAGCKRSRLPTRRRKERMTHNETWWTSVKLQTLLKCALWIHVNSIVNSMALDV